MQQIDAALIERILASSGFVRSERMCRFLRVLAERIGRPPGERVKETELGVLVFDREVGYDPKIDSIVRTEATRLRRKLAEYYAAEGQADPIRLQLPPGRYELEIVVNEAEKPQTVVAETIPQIAATPASPSRRWYWLAGFAASLVLAFGWWLGKDSGVSPALETVPFTYFEGSEMQPAFSPDGNTLAYTWDGEGHVAQAIYTQAASSHIPRRMTHSPNKEFAPVWSPDGSMIAFLRQVADSEWDVRTVDMSGSTENSLAHVPARAGTQPGLAWSPDGAWLVTAAAQGATQQLGLVKISPKTHEVELLPGMDSQQSYFAPAFARDGRLAYIKAREIAVNDAYVSQFPDGREQRVTFDGSLLLGLAWSRNDKALIVSSQRTGGRPSLWRFPIAGGHAVRLTESGEEAVYPAISGDGRKLAFSRRVDDINIWRRDLTPRTQGAGVAVIASSSLDSSPQFSPDGKQIAFRSSRGGTSEIWVSQADGSQVRQLTHMGGPLTGSPAWSPDGKWISFDSRQAGRSHIWVIPASGGEMKRATTSDWNELVGSWSRDGKFVYYSTDHSGKWSVWRSAVDGGKTEFVREGAFAAKESSSGYLYYARGPNVRGLFRIRLPGGAEEPVLPELGIGMWGGWALGKDKVYFIDWMDAAKRAAGVQVYEPNVGTRTLFQIKHLIGWDGSLTISPDEKSLVYAQLDRAGSDIFMVDHLQ